MASFCRVDNQACRLPSMLGALEEHDFLFQLHLNDTPQDDSTEVCAAVKAPPPAECGPLTCPGY